jgi:DNA-binding GntR family transcriptional regulator
LRIDKTKQAYNILKDRIFSGFYLPRQRLVESTLSNDLGVNRMMVRDILKHLAVEGLVLIEAYKGCTVRETSIEDVYQTYQVEAVLEGFAAFLATERINDRELEELEIVIIQSKKLEANEVEKWEKFNKKIHSIINRASRNYRLIRMISDNVKLTNYWFIILSTPGEIPKKNKEHDLILDAMKKKDPVKARLIMENHIMDSAKDISKRFQKIFPYKELDNIAV